MNAPDLAKIKDFIDSHPGGYWEDLPEIEDWQYDVRNGNTRQGFWEWLAAGKGIIEL